MGTPYTIYASIKYPTEDSMSTIGDNKDNCERVLFLQSFQIYEKPELNISCVIRWHVTTMLDKNYQNITCMHIATDVTSNRTFAYHMNIKI